MERLKILKDNLVSAVTSQMSNLQEANCEEMGAAIDMIKDISEAIYYCSIVKAMDESDESSYSRSKYSYPPIMYDGSAMRTNKMYYHDDYYPSKYYKYENDDFYEGHSPRIRRTYMEAKELHKGKETQMKELEKYLNELSSDITEMISDASQEERTILSQKLTNLIDKIR